MLKAKQLPKQHSEEKEVTLPRSLDHFVHLCRDLEHSAEVFSQLGFHVRPIAKHIEVGSSNCVIHFADTYLEFINIEHAIEAMKKPYLDRFRSGEGVAHVSLTSSDLHADHNWASKAGLTNLPIWSARRKITRPDGNEDETDSSFFYMWREQARYMSLFLSEHKKPETIFIKEFENHQNTAIDVRKLVYISADPEADRGYFSKLFGKEPDEAGQEGFKIIGQRGDITEVLSPQAIFKKYGAHAPCKHPSPLAGFVAAMHYSVRSLDDCFKTMVANGVVCERQQSAIIVPASAACGCTLVFEPV